MAKYQVRFIHKVGQVPEIAAEPVEIDSRSFSDNKALAKVLRSTPVRITYPGQRNVLNAGESIRGMRSEAGDVVVFPRGTVWHSIILTVEVK